ncbi:DUF4070 domain-containing protein [candidate division KSB1 bacterium]|nr:DUF4070 domain-containing protein [candidate division KSB1 bacterium]
MKILLISPETPATFWSFKEALKFIGKKSSEPPLGLLTVAALLPSTWEKKLIDLNVAPLRDKELRWADYVFLSGMNVHIHSMKNVIQRCNKAGVPVVAGGPLITTDYELFTGVDHFILNEAEATLPLFLQDLAHGHPQPLYRTDQFPDMKQTPIPLWHLLDMKKYANMSIQYSRGCPFNCEFCSITILNGRRPRTKSSRQLIAELESLYHIGWRGPVFIVDDNFIGNKRKLKDDVLPALIAWSKKRKFPFVFNTEVSINLADDDQLVKMMVQAGFTSTFVGIETPNNESLTKCGKVQNLKRDLVASVKKLHRAGLQVSGGFIIGFDQDPPTIFEQQINFIQKSGIITAMVGLLNAPSGTRLFERMKKENRLLQIMSGDNMDGTMNFIPQMNYEKLRAGYKFVVKTIYEPKELYERLLTFLKEYRLPGDIPHRLTLTHISAFLKSIWKLGLISKGRRYYWKLFGYSMFRQPQKFPLAITMMIYGYHFRRVADKI